MSTDRELVKSNWLQQKVCRISGTLLKKKKVHYEEAEWVVLCVHNKRIPLLEWYINERNVQDHRPTRVVDLLHAAFVNRVISNPRCFTVGFVHTSAQPLELSALTAEDCQDWIDKTTATLMQLNCFGDSSNIYSTFPEVVSNPPVGERSDTGSCESHDTIPQMVVPPFPNRSDVDAVYLHCSTRPTSSVQHLSQPFSVITAEPNPQVLSTRKQSSDRDDPPPLPPRPQNSNPSSSSVSPHAHTNSMYDFPKNFVISENSLVSSTKPLASEVKLCSAVQSPKNSASHVYGSIAEIPPTLSTEIAPPPVDSAHLSLIRRGYSVPNPNPPCLGLESKKSLPTYDTFVSPHSRYDFPVFSGRLSDAIPPTPPKIEKSHSVTVSPLKIYSKSERRSAGGFIRSNKSFLSNLDLTLEQHVKKPLRIALQRQICLEHIAFIDFNNKVWIGSWSHTAEKHLSGMIHVGDEVIQIIDSKAENVNQVLSVLHELPSHLTPVNFLLHQVPYGKEFTFTKDARVYDLGVVLQKHKNKVEFVREGSPAYKAGLRARMTACTHSGTTAAFIAQLNGQQLNLFSKNDEFLLKLKEVHLFTRFTLVVLPYDFVKIIKKTLKKLRNFSDLANV